MREITLGKTGIVTPQNAFGALPVQRVDMDTATSILTRAYEGGMTFFDTARAYSDSEEKLGEAFGGSGIRDRMFIATKTMARTPEDMKRDLESSLGYLRTDYIDIYQIHCVPQCYKPGDGTGMYEALIRAKEEGIVRHVGITTHRIDVAEEIVRSGLYETLQYPFSYLSSRREIELVRDCESAGMGFIAMKGLSGGLLTNTDACMAFMSEYEVLPIWGIQRMEELEQWLGYFEKPVQMTEELAAFIEKERKELKGEFCRGCGYCMPCPMGIQINQCARMSLMLRRAPSEAWLSEYWQNEMSRIENCTGCGKCMMKCPYELRTPELLRKNLEDYKNVLRERSDA